MRCDVLTPAELKRLHEQRLKVMVDNMYQVNSRLKDKVSIAISKAKANPERAVSAAFWMEKLKDSNALLDRAEAAWYSWLGTSKRGAIVNAVRDGERLAQKVFAEASMSRQKYLAFDAKTINVFVNDSAAIMSQAIQSSRTQVQRLFMATQQQLITERQINDSLTASQIAGDAPGSQIARELLERSENGQFVRINGRNYRIESYAENLARTRIAHAQAQGTINTVQEFGIDLVDWVASKDACPLCQENDGETFSISGTSNEYEALREMPGTIHPGCSCTLVPNISGRNQD